MLYLAVPMSWWLTNWVSLMQRFEAFFHFVRFRFKSFFSSGVCAVVDLPVLVVARLPPLLGYKSSAVLGASRPLVPPPSCEP